MRQAEHATAPRQRKRTARRILVWLLTLAAAALARQAWNATTARLDWTPPPPRSGDVMGADRAPARPAPPRLKPW